MGTADLIVSGRLQLKESDLEADNGSPPTHKEQFKYFLHCRVKKKNHFSHVCCFLFSSETTEKLMKREKEVSTLTSQVEALKSQLGGKCRHPLHELSNGSHYYLHHIHLHAFKKLYFKYKAIIQSQILYHT